MSSIAIICPYPADIAPGQRFRYEQYIDYLRRRGHIVDVFPFLDEATNQILYQQGRYGAKVFGVLRGFLQRFKQVYTWKKYDYIFVYREASPIGPPIFEWLIAKVLRKKMLVDFDDAIWLTKTANRNRYLAWLRNHAKLSTICTWAYKVSCGNAFLAQYAQQFTANTVVIPSTVDTQNVHNIVKKHSHKTPIIIGWTGTLTTMPYLDMVYPIIAKLAQEYAVELHIISNKAPVVDYSFIKYIAWQKESEIQDLSTFDIGIMPLHDTIWEQGKCGFKAIQYLALGIPALVSPVGMNKDVVVHGVNGYHAHNTEEWLYYLRLLINNVKLRQQLGNAGRQHVLENYSVLSQQMAYDNLFNND